MGKRADGTIDFSVSTATAKAPTPERRPVGRIVEGVASVPLASIDANPYQHRTVDDREHIEKLALSIVTDGLLQTPTGRVIDPNQAVGVSVADVFDQAGGDWQYAWQHM